MRYLVLLLLASCAAVAERPTSVREATADSVKTCTYLGLVTAGFTGGGILLRDTARESVVSDMFVKASEKGATHIVHKSLDNGWFASTASADAFRCP